MIGREDDYLGLLERAHRAHLDGRPGAAGAALRLLDRRHPGAQRRAWAAPAAGSARAQRLLDREDGRARRARLPAAPGRLRAGGERRPGGGRRHRRARRRRSASASATPDLFALAAHEQGHMLIQAGASEEGLRLLDEAMVAVTAGELSPIVSGIVYCGVILACQDAHEVRRAQEWTAALTGWCERQPDLVAFTGRCLVHRAEIMQLQGAWADGARRGAAGGRALPAGRELGGRRRGVLPAGRDPPPARRLRARPRRPTGRRAATAASRSRASPCCGSRRAGPDAAAAAIRRVVARPRPSRQARASVLPAYVEIMLAVGDVGAARDACRELELVAEGHESGALGAMAAHARGAVELAAGDVAGALGLAPQRRAGLAAARGAVRGGRARELVGAGLSRARRRGRGRARAGRRARGLRGAGRRARPRAARLARSRGAAPRARTA